VRTLPGVVSAAMVNRLPLAGGGQTWPVEFEDADRGRPMPGGEIQVDSRPVTPDYFRTLQIPLLAGRTFTEADDDGSPRVGIIDEVLAKRIFGDRNPIGRRFHPPMPARVMPDHGWYTIVGVVGHIRHERLEEDGRPQVYWSYKQFAQDRQALVVRTQTDPAALAQSIASAIRSVDPEQPVYDARPLDAVVDRSIAQRWLQTTILVGFAAIALVLASIGVYGVIAYGVGQRSREFGIRLALGARRAEIIGQVMSRGLRLFVAGGAIGLVAAVASARLLSSLLFNVSSFDVVSFGVSTLILLAVALAACALPARRAASVDPSLALRTE
jgi:putative ABC transport system permease protein